MRVTDKQLAEVLVETMAAAEGKEVERAAQAFVDVLGKRGEVPRARRVLHSVEGVWKKRFGASRVEVTSAVALPERFLQALHKAARGASVAVRVEPALIGGARIRVDDTLVDATIAGRLEALRRALL